MKKQINKKINKQEVQWQKKTNEWTNEINKCNQLVNK